MGRGTDEPLLPAGLFVTRMIFLMWLKRRMEGKERKIMVFGRVRTTFIFAQEILKKQSAVKLSSHSGYFEGLKPSRSQNTSKGEQSRKRKEKKKKNYNACIGA